MINANGLQPEGAYQVAVTLEKNRSIRRLGMFGMMTHTLLIKERIAAAAAADAVDADADAASVTAAELGGGFGRIQRTMEDDEI